MWLQNCSAHLIPAGDTYNIFSGKSKLPSETLARDPYYPSRVLQSGRLIKNTSLVQSEDTNVGTHAIQMAKQGLKLA